MVRVCQLNISGLSTQSTLAVDRLCDIRRVGILALQEVGPPPPTNVFTNMITFSVSAPAISDNICPFLARAVMNQSRGTDVNRTTDWLPI